jgi:hypothetical protein
MRGPKTGQFQAGWGRQVKVLFWRGWPILFHAKTPRLRQARQEGTRVPEERIQVQLGLSAYSPGLGCNMAFALLGIRSMPFM